jgi:hypothetical protein
MDLHGILQRACVATLAMGVTGATACGERKGDNRVPLGAATAIPAAGAMAAANAKREPVITAESQALLEVGNVAFRRKDYAAAQAAYEKAASGSPGHAAPWMGIYMVARVRNDTKAMDAAQAELNKRDPGGPAAHPAPDTAATKAPSRTGLGTIKN